MRWNGWKTWLVGVFLLGGLWLRAGATAPSMELVLFPANLGAQADGQVIPLTVAPAWLNHDYGLHPIISEPRGFLGGGGLDVHGGIEMNANLASVYGIDVEPEDSTQVPQLPVVLKVRDGWRLPEYSPFTREQALVATLWAVLANTPTTADKPVTIKVVANEPELARYAGKYALAADRLNLATGQLPGSALRRSARGGLEVVFDPGVLRARQAAKPGAGGANLVFVPMLVGGGESDPRVVLAPQWAALPFERLRAPWTAVPRASNFLSARHGENANPLHTGKLQASDPVPGEVRMSAWFAADDAARAELATACLASLLCVPPAADRPLKLILAVDKGSAESWQMLAGAGWQSTESQSEIIWTRVFSQMPEEILGWRLQAWESGGYLMVPMDRQKTQ